MTYDTKNADEVTVQLELDNGEVVQARYGRVIWLNTQTQWVIHLQV